MLWGKRKESPAPAKAGAAETSKRYINRQEERGLHQLKVWVPLDQVARFQDLAREARKAHLAAAASGRP